MVVDAEEGKLSGARQIPEKAKIEIEIQKQRVMGKF